MQAMRDERSDQDVIIDALTAALSAYERLPAKQQPTLLMDRFRGLLAAEPAEQVTASFIFADVFLASGADSRRDPVDFWRRAGFFEEAVR